MASFLDYNFTSPLPHPGEILREAYLALLNRPSERWPSRWAWMGANSARLRQAHIAAAEAGLVCDAFVLDMKDGAPVDQAAAIQAKSANDLLYLAVECWGETDQVRATFKRFSLFR